jgi:hypothetical protein
MDWGTQAQPLSGEFSGEMLPGEKTERNFLTAEELARPSVAGSTRAGLRNDAGTNETLAFWTSALSMHPS